MNMRFCAPLIAVRDLHASRRFYEKVLGQKVTLDLGANLSFGDQFAIQEDYAGLMGEDGIEVRYGGNDHELYFEEENFDHFVAHLGTFDDIRYLHRPKETPGGSGFCGSTTLTVISSR